MGGFLLKLVLACLPAEAAEPFADAELLHRRQVLTELAQAAAYADAHLPYCDDLDYLSNAALKFAPPEKDCPQSNRLHQELEAWDRNLRESCREIRAMMEGLLGNPSCPADANARGLHREKLRKLRVRAQGGEIDGLPALPFHDEFLAADDFERPKGEMANMRCNLPMMIALQFRKRQLSFFTKMRGGADWAIDDLCEPKGEARDQYLFRTRAGEADLEPPKTATSPEPARSR